VSEKLDFPFEEIADRVDGLIGEGATVYQKFTCVGCGQRLTMEEPNVLYTQGECDRCGAVTDLKAQGCNYLLVMDSGVR
jgi:predicted RNA-binding Zn-ribbon protein involved in translation (DUF1610 family)